ncbi:MAG: hypothetical protein ACRDJE_12075 [Dehalococcoidia bacterium]
MAQRGDAWVERVVEAAGATLGAAMLLLSVNPGGEQQQKLPPLDEDDEDYNPLNEPDDEGLPPLVEGAFKTLGLRGSGLHERTEGWYAAYRVLKVLGLSDADIARLILQKAGEQVDEGLDRVHPSDARGLFETVEHAVERAAGDVDERLDLHGDLARRIREGMIGARAGREEALTGLERGFDQGKAQLRRILRGLGRDDTAE